MFKNGKKKKSTTKKFKPDTSKLIPVIAVVEALILVAVSTFAWFFMAKNKKLSSGIITVQADSGLEIDFSDADKSSFIDIFNYIDKDTFYFEPATSVDGRNIYFPTSGTFDSDETENMVFREGTVNDINSKYINIDFELTNNSNEEMEIFLSNNSRFLITDDSNKKVNGKALRLAFYNNDGNSGKVDSSFTNKFKSADLVDTGSSGDADMFTVYFYRNTSSNWGTEIKAYLYDSVADTTVEITATDGSTISALYKNSGYYKAWPGEVCSQVSGNLYSYSFANPFKQYIYETEVDGEPVSTIYTSSTLRRYDTIMFSDGSDSNKTNKLTITNGKSYHSGMSEGATGSNITLRTVYFLKPRDWKGVPKCAVEYSGTSKWYAEASGGYNMSLVSAGVYSYTFPVVEDASGSNFDKIQFIASGDANQKSLLTDLQTFDATKDKKPLYYFPATGSGVTDGELYIVSDYSDSNLYFYNSKKWSQPYANINALADSYSEYKYTCSVPMIDLTGGLYYIEAPSVYMYDKMMTKTDLVGSTPINESAYPNNCQVYFSDKQVTLNNDGTYSTSNISERTDYALSKTNYIYQPGDTTTSIDNKTTYALTAPRDYSSELDITDKSYAVISPGVSAGFQRNANPVKTINNATGAATDIVPTFASAFDDYIMGSNNPVFKIGSQQTVNMSMIIWLEGTDEHCVDANYAGKNINLYLEFSTIKSMNATDETYTYRFTDSTEEIWTSNTVTSAGGVEVNPVMQMYDVDDERGYIMSGKSYSSYSGANKVRDWECLAPQSILNSGHKIEFRRVNPYNESEIWNVWQAGNITTYKDDSFDAKTRVVTFTAFADGSPDYDDYHTKSGFSQIPQLSCGGVWGNIKTQMLYLYDGRKDRNIEDTMGNDGECGYLFCHYQYTYPNSHETVTLEYKGSSHYNAFFSFVVPSTIYTQKPQITFPNYVMLSSYASNATQQKGKISYRNTYNAGTVKGQFYELNTANSGGAYEPSYWGSDVVYVQAKNSLGRAYTNSYAFYQICFEGSGGTSNFYSYMYENNNYGDSTTNNSFVAVVPSNGTYSGFHFEAAKHSSHGDKIRYDYDSHSLDTSVDGTTGLRLNTVQTVAEGNDGRILTLDWDYAKILYKNSWNDAQYSADDNHTITAHYGDNGGYTYTLKYMTTSNNQDIYEAYVVSSYDNVYLQTNTGSQTRSVYFSAKGKDAWIFEPENRSGYDQWYAGQFNLQQNQTTLDGNNNITSGTYNKVSTSQYNNSSWPEYTPESNYDPSAPGA